MDQEIITLTYRALSDVFQDLNNMGETNQHRERRRSLMTPRQLRALQEAYEVFRNDEGNLVVSVELIYGMGWKREKKLQKNTSEICIPVSEIKRMK
jgi:malonyl-CoA O-methyltransferase